MSTTNENPVLEPYLFFNGRCEEAIEFYQRALGAKVGMIFRFKDNPEKGSSPPGSDNKIMHASFEIGGRTVMASDGHCGGKLNFDGFSLSLRVPTVAAAEKLFSALSEGGQVQMPLAKTFYSPSFGMVNDRFGLGWMIMAQA